MQTGKCLAAIALVLTLLLPENRFQVTGNTPRYRSPVLDALVDRYVVTIPRAERLRVLG